jgi:hypothetical protein
MKRKLISLLASLTIIISITIITSCQKKRNKKHVSPNLPPIESMSIPLKDFTISSGINKKKSYLWFGVSTLYIRIWREEIGSTLTLPSASFKEAFNHKGIQIKKNLWRWSYTFTLPGEEYYSQLEASFDRKQINWKMFISKKGKGAFSRFKWFTGISKNDGTSGSWVIYESPTEINVIYMIDWQKNLKNGSYQITINSLNNGKVNKSSYINYKKTNAKPYDATYTIYDGRKNKTIKIQWNSLINEGSIKLTQNKIISGPHYWDFNKTDLSASPY